MVTAASRPQAVRLRPALPEDAEILHRWRAEPGIRRHQPIAEATLSELRADLARQPMEGLYRGRGERFQWILVADGQPVGWLTLAVASWEHGLAEVGYALSERHRGHGWMREGLELLVEEIFAATSIARLEARCAVENVASQRVLERVGFRKEGLLRGYFALGGRRVDNWLYARLVDDRLPPPGELGPDRG